MKSILLTCVFVILWLNTSVAQVNSAASALQWLGWFHLEGIMTISPKWETILELEVRRFQFINNEHQYFGR